MGPKKSLILTCEISYLLILFPFQQKNWSIFQIRNTRTCMYANKHIHTQEPGHISLHTIQVNKNARQYLGHCVK